mmetsp:Transcript_100468/g.251827  ORF Transcript_100468/g.251827 Transcript_100468/m.251827 type:complete len:128 (+) Transcript_100468:667-1050(+)
MGAVCVVCTSFLSLRGCTETSSRNFRSTRGVSRAIFLQGRITHWSSELWSSVGKLVYNCVVPRRRCSLELTMVVLRPASLCKATDDGSTCPQAHFIDMATCGIKWKPESIPSSWVVAGHCMQQAEDG